MKNALPPGGLIGLYKPHKKM